MKCYNLGCTNLVNSHKGLTTFTLLPGSKNPIPYWQLCYADAKFSKAAKTRFNFDEMLKSWMHQPSKFSKRSDDLNPVTWFKEPYSLLAAMLCRLYGLPNCSVFKAEWAPIAHRVLAIDDSFLWESILLL